MKLKIRLSRAYSTSSSPTFQA